jgi:hypothetical protein
MKKLFNLLYPYLVTYTLAYLVGSFVAASFIPSEWIVDLRALMCVLALAFGYMLRAEIESEDGTV